MALQAESLITFGEQPLVDRAMRRMADSATFPHRVVLKHKRSALRGVTLQTGLVPT